MLETRHIDKNGTLYFPHYDKYNTISKVCTNLLWFERCGVSEPGYLKCYFSSVISL